MALRADTASLVPGKLVASLYAGHGVLGADVPTTGQHGAPPLANDVQAGDEDKEFRFLILTKPVGGTITFNEDSTFTATGYPIGSHSGTGEGFMGGVSYGVETYTLIVTAQDTTMSITGAGGIASLAAVGTPSVTATYQSEVIVNVTGAGAIASTAAIGTPSLTRFAVVQVNPSGIPTRARVGRPIIIRDGVEPPPEQDDGRLRRLRAWLAGLM